MLVSVPAHLGYTVLAALVAGESAGLPIPGETALVSAALLVGSGGLSLPLVVGVAAVAAIVGDNIGYWFGRRAGRRASPRAAGRFGVTASTSSTAVRRSSRAMAGRPSPWGASSPGCVSSPPWSRARAACRWAGSWSRTPSERSPGRARPPRSWCGSGPSAPRSPWRADGSSRAPAPSSPPWGCGERAPLPATPAHPVGAGRSSHLAFPSWPMICAMSAVGDWSTTSRNGPGRAASMIVRPCGSRRRQMPPRLTRQ